MMIFLFSCKKINKEKSDIDTSNKDVNISKANLWLGLGEIPAIIQFWKMKWHQSKNNIINLEIIQ